MSERPDSTKYKGDGSTSDFIADTDDYIDKIEQELAASKADRVAISQQLSDALDALFASNNQLAEARAEIEKLNAEIERLNKDRRLAIAINSTMQEVSQDLPDLRGHECLAKHKLLSLFDFWKKEVRPRLPGFIDDEISRRDKLIEQMRVALKAAFKYPNTEKLTGTNIKCLDNDLELIKAALSAAERINK